MSTHEDWFLADPKDKERADALNKKFLKFFGSGLLLLFAAIVTVTLTFSFIHLPDIVCEATTGAIVLAYIAADTSYAVIIYRQRKALWESNEQKLTDSEIDRIRKQLQTEWYVFQKTTNLVFIVSIATGAALGLTAGFLSTDLTQSGAAKNVIGVAFGIVILFCIAAFLIYTVLFVRYQRRVKPYESKVCQLLTAYYEKLYEEQNPTQE